MRPAALIMGAPRSGGALLTTILAKAGLFMGEDVAEMRLLMAELAGALDCEPHGRFAATALPEGWLFSPAADLARRELLELVETTIGEADGRPMGFYDPWMARFLPLWQEVFAELEIAPQYVLAVRNPADAAASMMRSEGLKVDVAEMIWRRHNAEALAATGARLAAMVDHGEWFCAPCEAAIRLCLALDLRLGRDQLVPLIDPDKDHGAMIEPTDRAWTQYESMLWHAGLAR